MKEALKASNIWADEEKNLFTGCNINIGCGNSIIKADCRKLDISDGDANCIGKYAQDKFDYVFSPGNDQRLESGSQGKRLSQCITLQSGLPVFEGLILL